MPPAGQLNRCYDETMSTIAGSRKQRFRSWLRVLLVVLVAVFAVIGAFGMFRNEPTVGRFRSAEGFERYRREYDAALAEMPTPQRTIDVSTDFGTVRAYEWYTENTEHTVPVVLLPGRASGAPMWSENLRDFMKQRRIIALDAIGDAGLSTQRVPIVSPAQQAQWVHQALEELAADGAHIVGHSFGGSTAATYARHYPNDVRSLTLLEPAFVLEYPPLSVFLWASVTQLPGLPQSSREYALGKISGTEYSADTAVARMIDVGSKEYSSSLPTPRPLTEEEARALTMPVYIAIAGGYSLAGGTQGAETARSLVPQAQIKIWENTTHSLPMEVAEPLAVELEEFWQRAND